MSGHSIEDYLLELGLAKPDLNKVLIPVFSEEISSKNTKYFIVLLDDQESILHPGRFACCEVNLNNVLLSLTVFEHQDYLYESCIVI